MRLLYDALGGSSIFKIRSCFFRSHAPPQPCFLKAFIFEASRKSPECVKGVDAVVRLRTTTGFLRDGRSCAKSGDLKRKPSFSERMAHALGIVNSFHVIHHLSKFLFRSGTFFVPSSLLFFLYSLFSFYSISCSVALRFLKALFAEEGSPASLWLRERRRGFLLLFSCPCDNLRFPFLIVGCFRFTALRQRWQAVLDSASVLLGEI